MRYAGHFHSISFAALNHHHPFWIPFSTTRSVVSLIERLGAFCLHFSIHRQKNARFPSQTQYFRS